MGRGASAWVECQLGDMLTLKRGYDLPEQNRQTGSVPIVSSSGISGHHAEARVKGPGVVTGRYGTLGEVFYLSQDFWPLNTTLYVQDFKGNDPRFTAYFLRTINLAHHNVAGAVPGVNRNALHMLRVRKPPVPDQVRIVSVLAAYDDLIENNSRRVTILEEMARALYREWFVNRRFPGNQTRGQGSGLEALPTGWTSVPLETVARVNAVSIKAGAEPGTVTYVDIASVVPGRIEQVQTMSFEDAPGRARRIVRSGDIIWSMVRPNRRSFALIFDPPENMVVSTGFAVLSPAEVPTSYLYHAVTTDEFVAYLTNHAKGAAYPAVGQDDFKRASIVLPNKETLEQFDAAVEPMLRLKHILHKHNAALRTTRDLLLPKLISGEIDLASKPSVVPTPDAERTRA